MNTQKTIWTVGHSTRKIEDFLGLLNSYGIEELVDVRRFPGSLKFPQFNKANLEVVLPDEKIQYLHIEALGGRRKAHPESENIIWKHPSFRGYADYMETPEFKEAMVQLEALALQKKCAIMCSEAVWWRCHRSMIADQLKANGWTVFHIMGEHQEKEHPYTKPAQIKNGQLAYH